MSEISQLVQMVTALTNRLNAIENNGKKIDELAALETLNPSGKIHISVGGVSYSIGISQLIEAISNANHDQIVSISGSISVDDNVVTVPPLVWLLENILYQTSTDTDITIPYCATGLNRKDIFVLNDNNEVVRVAGPEDADIIIRPNVPIGTLLLTEIDVSDSTIGVPTEPITGTQYIKKNEYAETVIEDAGDITIGLDSESTAFVLTGAVTSIIGFEMSDVFIASNLYIGKKIKLTNNSGGDISIEHNGAATYPARFPLETDFIWKNNEAIVFEPVKRDQIVLQFVSVGRDGAADISGKEDSSNKKTTMTGNEASNVFFLSAKAVYDWAVGFFVPKTRTITINGTTQDLSADRSFTVSSGVTPKIRTLTSADLYTQDIAGFKTYLDALSPNLTIATSEFYDFHVTDTGQIFSYKKNGVTVGVGQTPIIVSDVLEIEKSNIWNSANFSNWKILRADALGGNQSAITFSNGLNFINDGTAVTKTSTYNTGNFIDTVRRIGIVSLAAAGSGCGRRVTTGIQCSVKSGFYFIADTIAEDSLAVSTARDFVGLGTNFASPYANAEPSTNVSCVLLAHDSTDSNMQIMHNDTSGNCTKINLGSNFPANTISTDLYRLELFCFPNGTLIYYRVTRLNTGHVYEGSITTNMPASSIPLTLGFWRNNGTTALAVTKSFSQIAIATPY